MAIEITSFRKHVKNSLQAFVSLRLTAVGLEISGLTLHEKNNKRWLAMPAKPYEADSGETKWAPIVSFFDPIMGEKFQKAALSALDQFLAKGGGAQDGF